MEKFWAVILIFAIVAAGGLLYVNQVYAPQKDAQVAMAETANLTLTAVKMGMDNDTTTKVVTGHEVISQVKFYCSLNSSIICIVNTGSSDVTYINDAGDIETQVDDETEEFTRTPVYKDGTLESIRFVVRPN
ncbi:MAG TPA: hypothetical protein VEF53_01345 [Patescibacteria group bacterium]|nr:hypothetical protein [Patescibacteria group bacterium]